MDMAIIESISTGLSTFQPLLQGTVGAVIATLFLRKTTSTSEYEKVKAGKFDDAVDSLLHQGKMTYSEYYKSKNFLQIARLADKYLVDEIPAEAKSPEQAYSEFDVDWFVRFFEAAGSISNNDMQELWAKVLAGEVKNPGNISLRTVEILRNMSQVEALEFQNALTLAIFENPNRMFFFAADTDHEQKLNESFGLDSNMTLLLEDCGLISSMRTVTSHALNEDTIACISNGIIAITISGQAGVFKYPANALTQSANELFHIIAPTPNTNYLLALGSVLQEKLLMEDIAVAAYSVSAFDYNDSSIRLAGNDLLGYRL